MHPQPRASDAGWSRIPTPCSPGALEIARQSGVPEEPLRRYAAERELAGESGIAGPIEPDRDLLTGVTIDTDLGDWIVHETPGHAPSHVCLFQPERRLLISGDHLLGRISLYFDYGYSPDPVGEFLHSLDVVERLGARLCLPGHGRTFTDVHAHIQGNRRARRRTPEERARSRGQRGDAERLRGRSPRLRRLAVGSRTPTGCCRRSSAT